LGDTAALRWAVVDCLRTALFFSAIARPNIAFWINSESADQGGR
jgi:hypothetical protein